MFGLPLRIGFADGRPRQPITGVQLVKEPLALSNPQGDLVTFLQTPRQCFAIPEIGAQTRLFRWLANQGAHLFQLLGGEAARTPTVIAFGQARQALALESSHPVDHRTGRIAKDARHLFTGHAGGHERDAMQAVIIAGVLMAVDFLLEEQAAILRVGDGDRTHDRTITQSAHIRK